MPAVYSAATPGTTCYRVGDIYHWSVWTESGGASGTADSMDDAKARTREFFDRLKGGL